jgi:hypothetical protein
VEIRYIEKVGFFVIYIVSEIYVEVGVGTFLPTPTPAAPKLLLIPQLQLHSPAFQYMNN